MGRTEHLAEEREAKAKWNPKKAKSPKLKCTPKAGETEIRAGLTTASCGAASLRFLKHTKL